MRILMLNPFYPPYSGGTEKHVTEVSKRLAKKHDVTVLTAQLPHTAKEEIVDGVRIVRSKAWVLHDLPKPLPPPIPIMPEHAKDLKRLLGEHDFVHAHNRFFYGLDLVAAAKKANKPFFLTLHNARTKGINFSTDFWGQAFDDTIGAALMNAANGILGVSQYTLDVTLPKKFKKRKAVAYNGVDSRLFQPKKRAKNSKNTVLCVARLVPQKGLTHLIDAMANVDATLEIIGRGPLEQTLKNRAKKRGVHLQLKSTIIPENKLVEHYQNADVFCLPSLWEPFGIVLCEAMATGLPVVATNIGGIGEIVRDKKDGFLVPAKNPAALAKKINTLLNNPNTAKKMGLAGRKRAKEKFNWNNTAKAYERFYTDAF